LARLQRRRATPPLHRKAGATETQRREDPHELEPLCLRKKDAASGADRMDLHRGIQIFLRLVAREILALQSGANGARHPFDYTGGFVELQLQKELPGKMWSLLHGGGLAGCESSIAIRQSRSSGNADQSVRTNAGGRTQADA